MYVALSVFKVFDWVESWTLRNVRPVQSPRLQAGGANRWEAKKSIKHGEPGGREDPLTGEKQGFISREMITR